MAIAVRPAKSAISQLEPHRLKCPCGQYGCLETVCSGASVGRLWPNADPPMPDLIRRAKKREAEAVDVLDMVVRAIGDTIQDFGPIR